MAKLIQKEIINALSSGEFISGQLLGEVIGVSRTAVSKHVKALIEMGLDIYSVTGKGYKLAQPLNLLSQVKIADYLAQLDQNNKVEVHTIIDSTNSYLMRQLSSHNINSKDLLKQGQVCLAEYQSEGRGRRGRKWISPFGSHLYLSLYWQLEQGLSGAMGLSLVTALAISDAIKELLGINVELKWPNDVYIGGVKLAGILIELEGQVSGPSDSVIGVGLNLRMSEKSALLINQPWTDLQSHSPKPIDRNRLCAVIISCLIERLKLHQEKGLTAMVDEWHKHDIYLDKKVKLITGDRETKGICRGINNQGALLLEVDGVVKSIYGGEVSLRVMS
jgi:BirA family biotin operon repressor/biotin-[acetyl-CoA-carboxylase] ligase